MNIIGTGLSGLVGSRVVELLSKHHSFEDLSLETGVDITDFKSITSRISASKAIWIFHFAAYTNVQEAEKEKDIAWKINVGATENIVSIAKETGKKLVYIDTDYAFDGKKQFYTEQDSPNPLGWYAKTKYEGAKRVLSLGANSLVIRISNPYRANPVGKKDFVHKMIDRLRQKQTILAPTDQIFVPTFIDDIATALETLLARIGSGLFHVVGSTALSPYDAAIEIAKIWRLSNTLVQKTTFAQFFKDRAPIPQLAALKNDKIRALGVTLRTFEEGLQEVKRLEYNSV
ncbi:hypothetical protein A3A79_04420 [Candidatus Gottesmanbacteria bacterium RIFCSPLOWO2_01_FULL_43_11b]|uniref:dTDP-4-dehydrorhamnose reductase n=1 Tax=Candidatus Gottesmanbacteria bacterium RIFCSPLOWO2_01_FULL_43_11b TaxID=1798392 RepID=A0A1F6AI72_9BACT|nr:MAG: hypothetical protein A3A79_04420 [Candidatus Gottesmanbacteria bacterium RIFCSPLOWO2_01_FULL_43_11b]